MDQVQVNALVKALRDTLGSGQVVTEGEVYQGALVDYLHRHTGRAIALVLPGSTDQVAHCVRLCRSAGVAITPQGGNTGLVAGGVPGSTGDNLVLGLGGMKRIRSVSPNDFSLVAEAGVTVAAVQTAADEHGLLFPLSLGSEGSCQIGGAIATNAGGHGVLRYGSMRDLVLGIEAVLDTGMVVSRLIAYRKNNTGYDLRHLFCGSEGTLGIITAASLRLFPRPVQREAAIVACESVDGSVELYARLRGELGEFLSAFELIPQIGLELTRQENPDAALTLGTYPWFVLVELTSACPSIDLQEIFHACLAQALETSAACDAIIATSERQREEFWKLREAMVQAQVRHGPTVKHDFSLPISGLAAFLDEADATVRACAPDALVMAFGHLGDGNIHYNVSWGPGRAVLSESERANVSERLYRVVTLHGGSISAEHGVGVLRRESIRAALAASELDAMGRIKHAMDPDSVFNPGKVICTAKE